MIGIHPRDLALFLLASGETTPRVRARDQQADIAGLELKGRVLDLLVAIDPQPEELEAALAQVIETLGPPSGPTRAICRAFLEDWEATTLTPEFGEWLLGQAIREGQRAPGREGQRGKKFDR